MTVADPVTTAPAPATTPAARPATPAGNRLIRPAQPFPWKVVATSVLYLIVLVYFSVTGLQQHFATTQHRPTAASVANDECPVGAEPTAAQKRVQLAPRGSQITTVAFGRELNTEVREFEYDAVDTSGLLASSDCLRVRAGQFLRNGSTESAQLDNSRIQANAVISGQQVLVTVTMSRLDAAFGPAGSYTGTISVIDPRIERVDIPLTITLAYPVWRLPFVVLWLVLPVATGYLWLLRGSFHGRASLSAHDFEKYVFSRNGILAVSAGTTASVLVFSSTYLNSTSWGGDFVDAIALFGSMFTAFAAASTPVTASGSDKAAADTDAPGTGATMTGTTNTAKASS